MGCIKEGEDGTSTVSLAEKPEDALNAIARLDTCVTVVDAANFFSTFDDLRFEIHSPCGCFQ